MICPSELLCSMFADGELPEAESREVALHLEACEDCNRLVVALRGEGRMLVQCLQDADFSELVKVPELASARPPVSIMRFALGILGAALAFRLSTSILFGLKVPLELQWLDPRGWSLDFGVVVSAVTYGIQSAALIVAGAAEAAILLTLGGVTLAGMARLASRSTAAGTIVGAILCMAVFASSSYAIDVRKGKNLSVPAGEIVDDTLVVVSGDRSFTIAGTVKGDLLVFGDSVTISGTVEGNVLAFARRVEITGTVGGTVVTGASALVVSGQVGRNLAGFAGNINVGKSAQILGNTALFGGESVVEGSTAKDLMAFSGLLDLRGDVGRNVLFRGGQVVLSEPAHVGGNLKAHVGKEENVRVESGAVIAGARDIQLPVNVPAPNRYLTARFYIWQIVRILAAFITGLILFRLFPAVVPARLASGKEWLTAGGLGFVALVTVPFAAFIVGITMIGLPVALLSFALWLAGLYLSKIVVAEFVGRSLMHSSGAVPLLAGLLIVVVAVNLPWIGGLINFLLVLLGLGAIVMTAYRSNVFRGRSSVLAS
jgi:hypothetical protein